MDSRLRVAPEAHAVEALFFEAENELYHDALYAFRNIVACMRRGGLTCLDTYIIGMSLLASVLIYPAGEMAYVDALFFGSGAATQSGLNT
jgi:hypothetical protein